MRSSRYARRLWASSAAARRFLAASYIQAEPTCPSKRLTRRRAAFHNCFNTRFWFVSAVIVGCLAHSASRGLAQSTDPDSVFEASGFQKNRAYFSQLPFENIDMVSGNLMLTFTDLVLPGNAGMDVRIQRTYNHNGHPRWSFGLAGIPLRVRHPDGPTHCGPNPKFPTIVTADGGEQKAFPRTPYPELDPLPCWPLDTVFLTSDFWRWDRSAHVLQLPNGWTIQYSSTFTTSENSIAYAEEVRDPFNNRITLDWQGANPKALWKVHQWFGGAERVIEFETSDIVYGFPERMTYADRVWTYSGGATALSWVTPPVGPGWSFDYSDGLKVTTPGGGETHYRFKTHQFLRLQPPPAQDEDPKIKEVNTVVVHTRSVSDGQSSGTWTYDYGHEPDGERITVVYPDGRQMVYVAGLTTQLSWEGSDSGGYAVVRRILKSAEGVEVEREQTDYGDYPVGHGGYAKIGDHSAPIRRVISRGGQSFQTEYHYGSAFFADYHRPFHTVESGNAGTRTTNYIYDYNFEGWIKDRIASQAVSSPGGSFTITTEFDDATGFKRSETRHGLKTTFEPTAEGNVLSATDGHQHTTTFTYAWGTVKDTITPEYQITRTINGDYSTVASETRRGNTTTYEYDALGRLRWVRPARGHWFETVYDNQNARWIEQRRLSGGSGSATRFDLDRFGRLIETSNRVGVRTRRAYDIYGRRTFQSQPYIDADTGTTFDYDALDRVTKATTSDGHEVVYDYQSGVEVWIKEVVSGTERITKQHWRVFGDPSDAVLSSLTDAEGKLWSYEYSVLGHLTKVIQPGGALRVWTYDGDRLTSETHPESGEVHREYRRAVSVS